GAKPQEMKARRKEIGREIRDREERAEREAELIQEAFDTFKNFKPKARVESEALWREIHDRYSQYFVGGMGAEAIKDLLSRMDLDAEMQALQEALDSPSQQKHQRATQRRKV